MHFKKRKRMQSVRRRRKVISLDITPAIPAGSQLIQGYGAGRFRLSGQVYHGSILLSHVEAFSWSINDAKDIRVENLSPLITQSNILIVGCGAQFIRPPEELRANLKEMGISLEWMDTGAACRTFNVLLIEERDAVAALIAVD